MFRSNKHIYAQVIDDVSGRTLAAASTVEKSFDGADGAPSTRRSRSASSSASAPRAPAIDTVVFDRGGFNATTAGSPAIADGAREAGLTL